MSFWGVGEKIDYKPKKKNMKKGKEKKDNGKKGKEKKEKGKGFSKLITHPWS